MFRATAILAILACAAAFAPSARVARSGALKMSFESEIGSQAPLGFWDPLGLLKDADQERFDRLRYVENKHGRISMLAVLGHLTTTSGVHLPGDIAFGTKFAEIDSGLAGLFGKYEFQEAISLYKPFVVCILFNAEWCTLQQL